MAAWNFNDIGSLSAGLIAALKQAVGLGSPATTDVAPGAADIHGGNAYPQATGANQTGADLNLSGGIGSRFFTVVDFSGLAGNTITIIHTDTDGEHTNIFTEGVDWTAATSNAATAASIAAMTGEFGTFANVGDVAYLTPPTSARTLTISTDGGADLTATSGADGVVDLGGGGLTTDSITSGAAPVAADPDTDLTLWTTGGTNAAENVTLALPSVLTPGTRKTFLIKMTTADDLPEIDTTNFGVEYEAYTNPWPIENFGNGGGTTRIVELILNDDGLWQSTNTYGRGLDNGVLQTKGGPIHTAGGVITTGGGSINTNGGAINTADGNLELGAGTAGVSTLVATSLVSVIATTVAGLPSAAGSGSGAATYVTDSNATLAAGLGNTVVGGGANFCPVHSDGANWKIG